jgi:periplasmic divalent cation tolerance protein
MNAQNRERGSESVDERTGMKEMESYIQVVTTTENKKDAEIIAGVLIDRKLAGCIQIVGPITSIYRWKGQVETAEEWQCMIKSRQDLYEEIEKAIKSMHSYEVPEIIALPIHKISRDYRDWLNDALI